MFGALLRSRALQFLGTISYSFYLWHTPVMFVTKRLVERFVVPSHGNVIAMIVFGVGSLPIVLAVSYLSYRILEQFVGRLLRERLTPRPLAMPAPEPSAI